MVPEVAVKSQAIADGQQIAVGSADGYPAIWRKAGSGPGEAGGASWTLVSSLSLVSAEPGLAALTSVTYGPAGWLAVGVPGPVVFTSANGTTWQPARGSIARGLAGVVGVAAAAGPDGYVIVGKLVAPGGACVADVWWSPDLTDWTRAHDVNDTTGSSQVLAVAANAYGFVSAGSHDGQPAVWTTTDGRSLDHDRPAAALRGHHRRAAAGGCEGHRVVALGQQTIAGATTPLAELSADGGATFKPVPFASPGPDPAITALTAGAGGFTAAALAGAPGQQEVTIWTSVDGSSWTRSSATGTDQLTALSPAGPAVTAIGSAATPQSQRLVVLTLPAR